VLYDQSSEELSQLAVAWRRAGQPFGVEGNSQAPKRCRILDPNCSPGCNPVSLLSRHYDFSRFFLDEGVEEHDRAGLESTEDICMPKLSRVATYERS